MKVDWNKKDKFQCPRCGGINLTLEWDDNFRYTSILYEEYRCRDCNCKFEAVFRLYELKELEEED